MSLDITKSLIAHYVQWIVNSLPQEMFDTMYERADNDEFSDDVRYLFKLCLCLKYFALPIIDLYGKESQYGLNGANVQYNDSDNSVNRLRKDMMEHPEDLPCVTLETTFDALSETDDESLSLNIQYITEDINIGDQIFQCIRENTSKAKRLKKFKAIIEEHNLSLVAIRYLGYIHTVKVNNDITLSNANEIPENNIINAFANIFQADVTERVFGTEVGDFLKDDITENFSDEGLAEFKANLQVIEMILSASRMLLDMLKQQNLSYTSKKELAQIEASPYMKYLDDLKIKPLLDISILNLSGFMQICRTANYLAQSVPVDNSADMLNGLNLFIDQNFDFIKVNKVAFMDKYRAGLMEFVGSIKSVIELYSFAALFFPVKYGRGKGNSDIIKPGKRLKGIYWKNEPADIEEVIRILKDNRYFNHLPNEASVDKKSVEPGRRLTYLSKQAKKGNQWIIDFITEYWNNEPASDFLVKCNKKRL
jgi:hypothetical protein